MTLILARPRVKLRNDLVKVRKSESARVGTAALGRLAEYLKRRVVAEHRAARLRIFERCEFVCCLDLAGASYSPGA